MTLVIDASIAAAWFIDDESDPRGTALLQRVFSDGATVPALFVTELSEALLSAARKKRLAFAGIHAALQDFFALPISIEAAPDAPTALRIVHLAEKCNISAYDAAYLETATRLKCALATHDRALATAAKSSGVVLI